MSYNIFLFAVLMAFAVKLSASQTSCRGRCGSEYYRGFICQCDYGCLTYNECCKDFEVQCTTKSSCKGRCGEAFKRGRLCSCDSDCSKYKQCCSDYQSFCVTEVINAEIIGASSSPASVKTSSCDNVHDNKLKDTTPEEPSVGEGNEVEDYSYPLDGPTPDPVSDLADDMYTDLYPSDDLSPKVGIDQDVTPAPESSGGFEPSTSAPVDEIPTKPTVDLDAPEFTTVRDSPPTEETLADDVNSTLNPLSTGATAPTGSPGQEVPTPLPTAAASSSTTENQNPDKPENSSVNSQDLDRDLEKIQTTLVPDTSMLTRPTSIIPDMDTASATPEVTTAEPPKRPLDEFTDKPDTKPVDPTNPSIDNLGDYQSDDSNDTDLCSGRPVSGVTTLRNGTMVVFRGHYFWFLDRNRTPGPARAIAQVWGVPSPIDTVFTRCNCQGKTYIFKGSKYWRFENDVLDSGYPKLVKTGFDGLRGHITAALSIPQYKTRGESVYFFKRGGFVQKYSYQFGTSPTCGRAVHTPIYTVRSRLVRQAVSVLEPAVDIRKSWRNFPSVITAAVSVPSRRDPEGYKYVVFSRSSAFSVKMGREHPFMAASQPNKTPKINFFKCPNQS